MTDNRRSGRGLRALVLAVAMALVWAAIPPWVGAQVREPTLEEFSGRYTFMNSARDRASYEEGIERAVGSLNALIRGLARGQIRSNTRPERRIVLEAVDAQSLRIQFNDWRSPVVSTRHAHERVPGPNGDPTRLSARYGGGRLSWTAATDQGTRESFFTLSPDGNYLFMQVRVSSDRLPESIRYTLTFRKEAS